jgi:hypothetical protein
VAHGFSRAIREHGRQFAFAGVCLNGNCEGQGDCPEFLTSVSSGISSRYAPLSAGVGSKTRRWSI